MDSSRLLARAQHRQGLIRETIAFLAYKSFDRGYITELTLREERDLEQLEVAIAAYQEKDAIPKENNLQVGRE